MMLSRLVVVAAFVAMAACSGSDDAAPVSSEGIEESAVSHPLATNPPATDGAPVSGRSNHRTADNRPALERRS
jgi:hypothetical protein